MDTVGLECNKQVVSGFFVALNDRRLEDLSQYMALDVVDHNKVIHGEDDAPGVAFEGFRQQLAAFDLAYLRVDELIAEAIGWWRASPRAAFTPGHTHGCLPLPGGASRMRRSSSSR